MSKQTSMSKLRMHGNTKDTLNLTIYTTAEPPNKSFLLKNVKREGRKKE